MNLNSFPEAVADYERLTGETFEWNPDEDMKVLDSNEFMTYRYGDYEGVPYFEIRQTYAKSFSSFVPFIREEMNKRNIKWIVTTTQRDPKAHIKKWKMKRLPEFDYEFEGRFYYVLLGHISNLK